MNNIVTRFAPSPTGFLHAGNYRTAVFAYLFAKKNNGSFILRIEDTDPGRSKPEYEENIIEALDWLNLKADKQYRQSEHRPRYRELLEKLITAGTAYISKEMPQNPGDREEVIRGEDHISNTPRQILIQRALGFSVPVYAHLPLILGNDRTKLSKRGGAKALTDYRDMGILPEAMLNYLAFLGWNPGDDREYLSRDELIKTFDLTRVQKGSAIFDEVKLLSVNQHWMRTLSDDDFISRGKFTTSDNEKLKKTIPLLKERTRTFSEAREMLIGEFSCFFKEPTINRKQLITKEPSGRPNMTKIALEGLLKLTSALPEGISAETVKNILMPYADALAGQAEEAKGKGDRGAVLWPLRYALSGQECSPDPFSLISILGIKETISRIEKAIAILGE